jgi:membrane associated rhomboid family serine protease
MPITDGIHARRFPWVNIALIAATGGTAFFAHIGGFVFAVAIATSLLAHRQQRARAAAW